MAYILVNGYSPEVEPHPNVGGLIQPRNWARARPWVEARRVWAIDNDYKRFDATRFVRLLTLIRAEHPDPTTSGCLFVAVPDVYRDHAATLALWRKWRDQVWGFDMPLAFVVQNGAHLSNVPWRDFRTVWRGAAYYTGAIFVGGDTAWKMGDEAAAIVRVANSLGLWTHVGRCNSLARIRHAKEIGADSVDGGGFSQFRKHLAWGAPAAAAEYQPRLL